MPAIPWTWEVAPPDDLPHVRCPECAAPLDLHQPDEELPDRMLGTCGGCKAWFLLDGVGGVIIRVPPTIEPAGDSPP